MLRKVAVVSKKLHKLSQDQHLIRKIEVDSETWIKIQEDNHCDDFLEVLKRSLNLRFLSIDFGFNQLNFPGEMFLEALPSMNHKFLQEVHIKAKDFLDQNILKYLENCPKLKVLKFEFEPKTGNEVTQIVIHKYLSWILSFKLKNLEEFHFGYELIMDDTYFFKEILKNFAENFPKLQRLCLTSDLTEEWDEFMPELCQSFASKTNIKLEIRGAPDLCNFDDGVKCICCGHYAVHPSKELKIFSPK